MTKVNFYLKDPKAKSETVINLFFHYNGIRLKYSTGESVKPKYWNEETQRVRVSKSDSMELNNLLDSVDGHVKRIYREALTKEIKVTNIYLRTSLDSIFKPEKQVKIADFLHYFDEFIEIHKLTRAQATIKKYKTLGNHLRNFQYEKKYALNFESLDVRFYDLFMNYLILDLKLLNNSSAKYVKTLKTFLRWAAERGYNSSQAYLKFKVKEKDADIIYLTEQELFTLYNIDLPQKPYLERVRDIFCFGCFTGLRYSDISKIRKENIKRDEITLVSEKTTERLEIPLNKFAKKILEKYNYALPIISNQKANNFLKELGQLAQLNEPVILTKFRGVEEIQIEKRKYEFLTTHTARRTFVTLSLEKGMRPEMAMSITGHKDYRTFKKYIKITSKVKNIEMKRIWDNEMPILAVV